MFPLAGSQPNASTWLRPLPLACDRQDNGGPFFQTTWNSFGNPCDFSFFSHVPPSSPLVFFFKGNRGKLPQVILVTRLFAICACRQSLRFFSPWRLPSGVSQKIFATRVILSTSISLFLFCIFFFFHDNESAPGLTNYFTSRRRRGEYSSLLSPASRCSSQIRWWRRWRSKTPFPWSARAISSRFIA